MKNQLKKSLSLIMAVLMILSCWVWIAPEKAEAATAGTYTVYMKFFFSEQTDKGGTITYDYWDLNSDGSINYNSGKTGVSLVSSPSGYTTDKEYSFKVTGFPYSFKFTAGGSGTKTCRLDLRYIKIGNRTVVTCTDGFAGSNYTIGINSSHQKNSTWGDNATGYDWPAPNVQCTKTIENGSFTLDKLDNVNKADKTAKLSLAFKDTNYGVEWSDSISSATISAKHNENPLDISSYASVSKSGATATVTVKPEYQKLFAGDTAESTITLNWKAGKFSGEESITVKNPKYDIEFKENGANVDPNSKELNKVSAYYGATIKEKLPGYESDGTYNRDTSSIKKPYHDLMGWYTTQISDNNIGNYNNPEKLTTSTKVTKDATYYAYWESANIDAEFQTLDGQYIATVPSKYNMSLTGKYGSFANLNNKIKTDSENAFVSWEEVVIDDNNTKIQAPVWAIGGITYIFKGWKIVSAYDLDGNEVPSLIGQDQNAVLLGKTVFRPVYEPVSKVDYTIKFYDAEGDVAATQTYKYGDAINFEPDEEDITLSSVPQYDYTFVGWAKKLNKLFYTVDAEGLDENGAKVTYISAGNKYFYVVGNCEYVPVFERTVRNYSVTYSYKTVDEDGEIDDATYVVENVPYGTKVEAPSAEAVTPYYDVTGYRFNLEKWTYNDNDISKSEVTVKGDMLIEAVYSETGIPTLYTVNFYDYKNDRIAGREDYTYGTEITEIPTVDANYADDDYFYTFIGWSTSEKRENPVMLEKITVTGDVNYYATYSKVAYTDVTFYDHNKNVIYKVDGKTEGNLVGDTIPEFAYTDNEGNVITEPSKAEDVYGKYTFSHWEDENGATVIPGSSKFTGDVKLYAMYDVEDKYYDVIFQNDNGDIISEAEYKYGETIAVPEEHPTKEADAMYEYTFKSWSPDVSEKCTGAATYTATYIRGYNYYTATWFGVPGDDGVRPVIKVVNYVSEERAVPVAYSNPEEAESGYGWVLTKWVRCDAAYNLLKADGTRADNIDEAATATEMLFDDEDLYFYPVFEQQENTYTVTFKFEDKVLGTVNIKHGKKLINNEDDKDDIDIEVFDKLAINEAAFLEDVDYHYNFTGWDADLAKTAITGNLTVNAITEAKAHNCDTFAEVVKAPTFTEGGKIKNKCESASCKKTEIVEVAPLNDIGNPVITISVGANGGYVNGLTEVYALVKDTNPEKDAEDNAVLPDWYTSNNRTSLVNTVEYYVAPVGTVTDVAAITGWNTAYSYDAVKAAAKKDLINAAGLSEDAFNALADDNKIKLQILNNLEAYMNAYEANVGTYLRNLVIADGAELTDGASYVIYVKATDRKGNTSYGQSAVISYDSTAPVILVSGDGFGTKYCSTATFTVTDNSAVTVTLNGTDVTFDADGKYTCEEAGRYTVTAKDQNGNVTTKTFEIVGKHSTKHYTVNGTCTVAGSEYDICERCGVKSNETVTAPAGHKLDSWTEVKATCLEDGYRTYKCTACKDVTVKVAPGVANVVTISNRDALEGEVEAINAIIADKNLDLSHLDAKGTHTWPTEKVKDENGNETEVEAWVIDKAATCSATGAKHRNCTKCGLREDGVVEIDPTAHKLQRKTLTKEADCTTEGEYTRKCKYCPYSEVVENIPALGHIAGEYEIIKPSTCEETGSKILKCGRCEVTIGEPIVKDNVVVGFDNKAIETAALGHRFVVVNEPYTGTETDSEGKEVEVWYQDYKCANECGETKTEKIDDLTGIKDVTVKFVNGTDVVKSFEIKIGETILAGDVPTPTKETDEKATYKFAYWATKDAEGNYSKIAFPVTAKEDVEYYAVFTETARTYNLTYKVDGKQDSKIGYLRHGDEITVNAGPKKAADATNVYTFSHWAIGANEYKAGDKITVTGNIELEAVYTTAKKSYYVMYGYTKEDVIATVPFEAGSSVTFDTTLVPEVLVEPDAEGHTVFTSWEGNAPEEIKANVFAIAQFDQVNHSFETVAEKSKAATCTEAGVTVSKCSVCGYEKTETLPALGHNLTEGVYDAETGITEQECQRTGCDYKTTAVDKFTVIFNVDGAAVSTLTLDFGTVLSADLIPADPKKTADDKTYTFKGWNDGTKTYTAAELAALELSVKADATFNAVFDEKAIEYTVTFLRDASTVYAQYTVGANGTVTYNGVTPTKDYDETVHSNFSSWKGYEGEGLNITITGINKDMKIYADFDDVKHTYPTTGALTGEATCEKGPSYKFECICGHSYERVVGSAAGHDYGVVDSKEPINGNNGYIKYECSVCHKTKEEVIEYETVKVTVKVLCNGAPKSGIKVEVQSIGGEIIKTITTNANGIASVDVDAEKVYVAWAEIEGKLVSVELTTDSKGNFNGTYEYQGRDEACTCACHRDNIWGSIFRFFHKMIKLFTGSFNCCGDPDAAYNK